MKPKIPITDPRFVYTPSTHTDIRQTFARARAAQQTSNVAPMKKRKA